MTREEAEEYLLNLSWKMGSMAMEDLNEHDGEKIRESIQALEQGSEEDMLPRQLFFDFRDKLNKWMFHNAESVCGNNMIDIDYLDGHISELFDELGIVKYDENGNRIKD